MRRAITVFCCSLTLILLLLGIGQTAKAGSSYLIYFDFSGSTDKYFANYLHDFDRFIQKNTKLGDTVILLPLEESTQNFMPLAMLSFDPPAGGVSPKKKEAMLEDYRNEITTAAALHLKEKPAKGNTGNPGRASKQKEGVVRSNILGGLVSAGDYFQQHQIPAEDRIVILFTDGVEQSAVNEINMGRLIPTTVPAKVTLPPTLNARIMMIGIMPPQQPGAQEKMRAFWEDAAKRTGSRLAQYIARYE